MAQLGIAPLRITPTTNTVRCAACGADLAPRAAGARITAHYEGPTLVRVEVHGRGRLAHDCDTHRRELELEATTTDEEPF